ncbi:MAG: nuclear transport factor 2 family protein [Bryobacterales bacterium]|nr:nuclear transport factor 2 family protein [Bryobacterales bacterium]
MSLSPALRDFAARYTAAWCSRNPDAVASFFTEDGSLAINGASPAAGRAAIAAAARSFMTAFPDLLVACDGLRASPGAIEYHWTLTGTNTGPGGTGAPVRISGVEVWQLAAGPLIARSQGSFDEADYHRQIHRAPHSR